MRGPLLPYVMALAVGGVAFLLIAGIVARSPYTHANLSPGGYNRTEIAYVGDEYPFEGFGLADPRLASTGNPAQDGRALFFSYGCASCHGLNGQGGAVGQDLSEANAEEISEKVRQGPKTMPAYESGTLSESDLEKLIAFLESTED